jgi:DNA end-binding protein Ku
VGKIDNKSPQIVMSVQRDYNHRREFKTQGVIMAASIWKGSISFGLLNIPVILRKAEEGHDLSFNLLDEKDLSLIKYKKINGKSGHEVPFQRIVKGYKHESGHYVIMNKEDFMAANPKATQTIDIQDFVSKDDIDLMYFERPYYLVPQKNGIKGYFLLVEALKRTNKVAVAKVVIRNKMHLTCVMPKGDYLILEMMRFGHEVLSLDEVDYLSDVDKPKFNPKEIKMAEELIEGMTAEWNPDQYKDTYYDDVMAIINTKVESGELKDIDWGDLPQEDKGNTGTVVDLMPLLRKSLEAKKAKRAEQAATKAKKKTSKKSARKKTG